jgi:glycine cleavage system H protein
MSSHVPDDLLYTASHEWVRLNSDGTCTVGITDHAQHALGDIVYVDPPAAGRDVSAGDACAVVESVKAASDVYSPVAGTIIAGNTDLSSASEKLSADPYGEGWLFRLQPSDVTALQGLLTPAAYRDSLVACGD